MKLAVGSVHVRRTSQSFVPVCAFPGCGRPRLAKGLCGTHYAQDRSGKELAPIVAPGGSLPLMFDPVEQQWHEADLNDVERVREAIYKWMDCEAGTGRERAAWEHFRRTCKAWLVNSHSKP